MRKFSYIATAFVVAIFLTVSTAFASSKTITLHPGWNTFSTPKVLSALSFSNGSGAGLFFYSLDNGTWSSIQANIVNIKPLEGFIVNNTNTGSIQVGLDYKTNLTPSEMLFQKSLSAGWNFLGISTETNPFGSIGSSATMSVDFTRTSSGSNLLNMVNSSFSTTMGNASIAQPELGEAYAVFNQSGSLYAGNQDQEYATNTDGSIAVTRNDGLSHQNVLVGSQNVTLYGIELSFTGSNFVSIPNLSFDISSTGAYQGNAFATLYISGTAVATKTITGSTLDFNGLNILVSNSQSVNIVLKGDFNDLFNSGTLQTTINTVGGTTVANKPFGAIFTMVEPTGTLAATTGDTLVNKTLLLAGSSTQKITSFKVTASNDVIKLHNITLTGTNLNAISNIRLTDSVGTVLGTASSMTNTGAQFTSLDNAAGSSIAMDHSAIFYVVADTNSSTNINGVTVNIAVAGSDIAGSNSGLVNMTGTNVSGASHDVSENTFKVTLGTPLSKALATDAMEFTVNAFGKNQVTLSGATFNNVLSGYTGSYMLTVFRKSDNAIVGTTTGSTGVMSFTTNNTIDAGTSATYIVKVVGAVVDSGVTTPDWTVSLTGLTTSDGLNAADYTKNTDTFPLTSVK